jgi:hypothetical protein
MLDSSLHVDLDKAKARVRETMEGRRVTRHIPAGVKRVISLEHEAMCAFPGCHRKAEVNHHVRRFTLFPRHFPEDIVPLCKAHEEIAHSGLIENEEEPPALWRVRLHVTADVEKQKVDHYVRLKRMGHR